MNYIGKHIKVVLFDFDDTLIGTIEAKWASHKQVARTYYHKELTDEELRRHWGKPLSTLVGLIYGTTDIPLALKREHATRDTFPKRLRDDTVTTLKGLQAAGYKLGVITAATRQSFTHDLTYMGLTKDFFDYTQTEESTIYHKPDPRVFTPTLDWIEELEVKPAEVVYVGDALHDMSAALGAGFEFIGITTGLVTQTEFKASHVQTINKLSELLQ